MILGAHGYWTPLDDLRDDCGASRDGITAADILATARQRNLDAEAFSCDVDELAGFALPQILFWDFDHFVVLVAIRSGGFVIHDPAHGRRHVRAEEFSRRFTGVTLTFSPRPDMGPAQRPPRTMGRLARMLPGSIGMFAAIFVSAVAMVAVGVLLPGLTRIFVDDYLVQGHRDWLFALIAGLLLFGAVQTALRGLHLHGLLLLQTKITAVLSARFVWRMLHLPVAFFERRSLVEVAGRTQHAGLVAGIVAGPLAQGASNIAAMIGYVAIMLCYSPILTGVVVAVALVELGVLRIVARTVRDRAAELQMATGQAHAVAVQGATLLEQVRATGADSVLFARMMEGHLRLLNAEQTTGRALRLLSALPYVTSRLTTLALLGSGALLVIWTEMTLGALLGVLILAELFSGALSTLTGLGAALGPSAAALDRLGELIDTPAPIPDAAPMATDATPTGSIILGGVTFAHAGSAPLWTGLSLTVESGQCVVISGSSASGKTTLARLIAGLLAPTAGTILFEQQDSTRRFWDPANPGCGFVDQTPFLPGGPLRAALTLWNPEATTADIEQALADACIADAVMSRPGGLDSLIGESGGGYSGGERQRLAIARALVGNPALLVLDDSTSALDDATQDVVLHRLRQRGVTVVLFTNRDAAIAQSDRAFILRDGALVSADAPSLPKGRTAAAIRIPVVAEP
jgi:ABC-type bacteriocin/lantibiotic exporter with double-glycine peptidase domain